MKTFLIILVSCISLSANAQLVREVNRETPQEKKYINIEGSPYLKPAWTDGIVTFEGGKTLAIKKLNFDEVLGKPIFSQASYEVLEFDEPVNGFKFQDSSGVQIFKNHLTLPDNENYNTYYQILFDGTIVLAKLNKKVIEDTRKFSNATTDRTFASRDQYFIIRSNKLYKISNEKSLVSSFDGDQKGKVSEYIKEKDISYKNEGQLIDLVSELNQLLK
ncbi:hypothetical protein GS399_02815 [Pedobacter sp. HMF7647]|uniref:Uncharacterized protein n=1 Tax=Hufsiella arboris TaxID=2695275 RepID=A0A7K1Y761_9SPHI|nr:hypothetical protein [Hufsiella arboris]MXV49888.1 hypothetical protein [Hufsiella arboris]